MADEQTTTIAGGDVVADATADIAVDTDTSVATQESPVVGADGGQYGDEVDVAPAGEAAGEAGSGEGDEAEQVYDLKLPDGALIDASVVEQTTTLAKELGIKPEAAQKMLDMQAGIVQQYHEKQVADYKAKATQWHNEVKTDPELGGTNFERTNIDAVRAIAQFGTPELKQVLNETGFGNHKLFVSFAAKIGRAMAEDSFMGAPSRSGEGDPYVKLYPNTKFE